MKRLHKAESGVIMLEIIAVLGMLAVLAPILYRQTSLRNTEVNNVNLASEIRMVKEAFSAFIQTKQAKLETLAKAGGATCDLTQEGFQSCTYANLWKEVAEYAPSVYNTYSLGAITASTVEKYDLYLYGKNLYDIDSSNPSNITPVKVGTSFYGVIVPKASALPLGQQWNTKRVARIASLIGVDGGIVQGDNFVGTMGTWELKDAITKLQMKPQFEPTYVAFTGFDSVMNIGGLSETAAFEKLHAWQYFSVGAGDTNCFHKNGEEYVISDVNKTAACDPLFWVGATNLNPDEKTASGDVLAGAPGNVYVKNELHVGRQVVDVPSTTEPGTTNEKVVSTVVAMTNPKDTEGLLSTEEKNKRRGLLVYDIFGNKRVSVDATGTIIAMDTKGNENVKLEIVEEGTLGATTGRIVVAQYYPTVEEGESNLKESLEIKPSGLISSENFNDEQASDESQTYDKYKLDPAYTSVMNDVKLASRGGARLSEILPNYIAKTFVEIDGKGAVTESKGGLKNCTTGETANCIVSVITVPKCPIGYAAALLVTPSQFDDVGKEVDSVKVSGTGIIGTVEGTSVKPIEAGATFYNANKAEHASKNLKIEPAYTPKSLAIKIKEKTGTNERTAFKKTDPSTVAVGLPESWEVTLGYMQGENWVNESVGESVKAIAQTYCVFDPANTTVPTKERSN